MAWHGCFHCAIRYVNYEGRLCDRCHSCGDPYRSHLYDDFTNRKADR